MRYDKNKIRPSDGAEIDIDGLKTANNASNPLPFGQYKQDNLLSLDSAAEARKNIDAASQKYQELDLTHLDQNKFYPIYIEGSAYHINHIEIFRFYAEKRGEGVPTMGLFLSYSFVGNSWGGNPIKTVVNRHDYTYRKSALLGYAGFYRSCVFLRGGYGYRVNVSHPPTTFTLFEVRTNYRPDSNSAFDLTFAPITETEAQAHPAMLDEEITAVRWDHSIQRLGE